MTHSSEDLHTEVACARCGGMMSKMSSFCPHCGYIIQKSLWERIREALGGGGRGAPKNSAAMVSTLLGLLISGFFFYQAYTRESLQSLIIGILALIMTLRAWFVGRGGAGGHVELPEAEHPSDEPPMVPKFFCENCSAQVNPDATECSKCGMKFG